MGLIGRSILKIEKCGNSVDGRLFQLEALPQGKKDTATAKFQYTVREM